MAHFNSFVRIPWLVLHQKVRPLPVMEPFAWDELPMRVWPNDIDFNFHLNNSRYLSAMDYGRVHMLARGRIVNEVLRARWMPVVGSVWITYRRSLPLWARFTLASRLMCWDERWFYMEQEFRVAEGLAAVGWVKGALLERANGATKTVLPQRVMDLVQPGIVSPAVPQAIQTLNELTRGKLGRTAASF